MSGQVGRVDREAGKAAALALTPGSNTGPGLSPRQARLSALHAFYRVAEHDSKQLDWTGEPVMADPTMAIQAEYIPSGFVTAGNSPLTTRRPTAPQGLVRQVVHGFTGLLFADRRFPKILVHGDPDSEDWMNALAEQGRLQLTAIHGRNLGGAMGAVCFAFKFLAGKIAFEVFDARWCFPVFADAERTDLELLEVKYTHTREGYGEAGTPEEGRPITLTYWYRRLISTTADQVWAAVPADDHDGEPPWDRIPPDEEVEHGFGFVPAEYVQNQRTDTELDGDPDCQGAFAASGTVDTLLAQASLGCTSNSDPTFIVKTDDPSFDINQLRKGSNNSIQLPKDSDATYLELHGSGPESARKQAEYLEERFYRLCHYVPETAFTAGNVPKTATEVERALGPMLQQADVLRGQYGHGLLSLLRKAERACRFLLKPRRPALELAADGGAVLSRTVVRARINLPEREVLDDDGKPTGKLEPRRLGPGGAMTLAWGQYFPPTLADVELAGRAAGSAKNDSIIDDEAAIRFCAAFFGVTDVAGMMKRMAAKKAADDAAADADAQADLPPADDADQEPAGEPLTRDDYLKGICTLNELRLSLGLGPAPDGDMFYAQYTSLNATIAMSANAVTSAEAAKAVFADAATLPTTGIPGALVGLVDPATLGPGGTPAPSAETAPSGPPEPPEAEPADDGTEPSA